VLQRRDDHMLGEILRISDSPVRTMQAVARALAEHLALTRSFFADVEPTSGAITRVHHGIPPDDRGDLPPGVAADLVEGRLSIQPALIAAPLLRDRACVAALIVGGEPGREWDGAELALVQEIAERTWLWVERERLVGELTDLTGELEARVEQRTQDLVAAYDELQRNLSEKEVLLKEIHHRVKNQLQVVSSLLGLQRDRISDPIARKTLEESQARVRSMALVHEKLYRTRDLSSVRFADYVRELIEYLWESLGATARGIAAVLEIGNVRLTVDHAIPCGLIINELVTNALKHAFPDGRTGTIRIAMAIANGVATMVIADDGIGLPPEIDPLASHTFGLDIVATFAEQLGAEVEVDRAAGTAFTFRFATPS
jgi:two-component sensor histidine kinase